MYYTGCHLNMGSEYRLSRYVIWKWDFGGKITKSFDSGFLLFLSCNGSVAYITKDHYILISKCEFGEFCGYQDKD